MAVYYPDSARITSWEPGVDIGVPGGIAQYQPGGANQRTDLIDVTQSPYYADNTGASDASAAILSAWNAATSGQVVYLPAGIYRIESWMSLGPKKGVTLRGAGASTVLDSRLTEGGATLYLGQDLSVSATTNIVGSCARDQATFEVSSVTGLSVGQLCNIMVDNDNNLPVLHVSKYNRVFSVSSRITAISGTNVTISPAIPVELPASLSPTLSVVSNRAEFCGIENLVIDATNTTNSPLIIFWNTYSCWVSGVQLKHTTNFHIKFERCVRSEMRRCDLRDRKVIGQANGAGLIVGQSTACLFENNIIYRIFPNIEVNSGSFKNAFLYNFCDISDAGGLMGVTIDSNHRAHNCFNLYEGNVAPKFQADGYFGSVSNDTVFRNWLHATSDTTNRFAVTLNLNRFTRYYNIIGNILGRTGYSWTKQALMGSASYDTRYIYAFGWPNIGNWGNNGDYASLNNDDPWSDWSSYLAAAEASGPGTSGWQEIDSDVENTLLLKANWNAADAAIPAEESLGGDTLPASMAYAAQPSWWPSGMAWPPFDVSNAATSQDYERLPAGFWFVNGYWPGEGSPAAPVITLDPSSQTVTEGANVTLTAAATGNPTPTWSWTKNGSPISGATSATLSLTSVTEADEASYVATATNSEGSDSSAAAVLTVNPAGGSIPNTNRVRLARAPRYAATVAIK